MDSTLLNKHAKFGAKIFRHYWVITFLVLGHFFKPHPVDYSPTMANNIEHFGVESLRARVGVRQKGCKLVSPGQHFLYSLVLHSDNIYRSMRCNRTCVTSVVDNGVKLSGTWRRRQAVQAADRLWRGCWNSHQTTGIAAAWRAHLVGDIGVQAVTEYRRRRADSCWDVDEGGSDL